MKGIIHGQYKLPTSTLQHSNKTDIRQATLCFLSSVKTKELAICLFLQFKWPVITFRSQGINFGFYSCKYLGKIISLASEFHRGTCSASQVHTGLIEKTSPAAAAAAAALWQPRCLAGNTMQQMQRSRKNRGKKRKRKPRHAVCLLSILDVQCSVTLLTGEVGVK